MFPFCNDALNLLLLLLILLSRVLALTRHVVFVVVSFLRVARVLLFRGGVGQLLELVVLFNASGSILLRFDKALQVAFVLVVQQQVLLILGAGVIFVSDALLVRRDEDVIRNVFLPTTGAYLAATGLAHRLLLDVLDLRHQLVVLVVVQPLLLESLLQFFLEFDRDGSEHLDLFKPEIELLISSSEQFKPIDLLLQILLINLILLHAFQVQLQLPMRLLRVRRVRVHQA